MIKKIACAKKITLRKKIIRSRLKEITPQRILIKLIHLLKIAQIAHRSQIRYFSGVIFPSLKRNSAHTATALATNINAGSTGRILNNGITFFIHRREYTA